MSVAMVPLQQATIRQYAKQLQLATVGGQFLSMAEEAVKQKQVHFCSAGWSGRLLPWMAAAPFSKNSFCQR